MDSSPFTPTPSTKNLTATPTSQSVALGVSATNQQVLVTNAAAVPVFVEFGTSTVTATTTASTPVRATADRIFTVGPGATHVAVIAATTAAAATYFTSGHGA